MPITALARALVALNSNTRRSELAAGAAFGVLLALVPTANLVWVAVFVFVQFLKVNYGIALVFTLVLKAVMPVFAPVLDTVGWAILTAPPLRDLFTAAFNAPIAPLTNFNDTMVSGGLAVGLILWGPSFFAAYWFVGLYRTKLSARLSSSRLFKAVTKIPLVKSLSGAMSTVRRVTQAVG